MRYSYTIKWTLWSGESQTVSERWFDTLEEMEAARRETAKRIGWTPPKWWQYWRWLDSPRVIS